MGSHLPVPLRRLSEECVKGFRGQDVGLRARTQTSYSPSSLKGAYMGDYIWDYCRGY